MMLDLSIGKVGAMQHDRRVLLPKPERHREMNLSWIRAAKIVDGERADMGYDGTAPAPQRPAYEVVGPFARKIQVLPEAVDAPVNLQPVAALLMEPLGLVGVAGRQRVGGGEVATLTCGKAPESVPRPPLLKHGHTLAYRLVTSSLALAPCRPLPKLKLRCSYRRETGPDLEQRHGAT